MSVASLTIAPGSPPARWEVRVPGSKSITNRALLLAGVADGSSRLQNPLIADDTEVMAAALRALGVSVELGDSDPHTASRSGPSVASRGHRREPPRCGAAKPGPLGASWSRCSPPATGTSASTPTRSCGAARSARCLTSLRAQGAEIEGEAFPLAIDARGCPGGW